MNDWTSRIRMTKREMLKVAGAILGLLFGCILVIFLLSRFAHRGAPQPLGPPPAATPAPTPRAGQ